MAVRYSEYAVFMDGVEQFRSRNGMQSANETKITAITWMSIPAPAAGAHTFEIRWRHEAGNTANQPAATMGVGRNLAVVELGP